MPILPPLLINNKLESDFIIKVTISTVSLLRNVLSLLTIVLYLTYYVSTTRLSSFSSNEEVILKIINALNINMHMVIMYKFVLSSYAVNLLLNPCLSFSRTALILVHFQISGRDQT